MNRFPLSPFLASLDADGIHLSIDDYARIQLALQTGGDWTIARLRDTLLVLLTRDPDQQELFLHRFDEFFEAYLRISSEVTALDLQQVLTDLQHLRAERPTIAQGIQTATERISTILPLLPKPSRPKLGFWTLWYALLCSGFLTVGYFFWPFVSLSPAKPLPTEANQLLTPLPVETPLTQPIAQTRKRIYSNVPYVAEIHYEPLKTREAWQRYAGLAAFLFFTALLYGLYLWRSHKIPEDTAPEFNPDGPSHFSVGSIGGSPLPLLNDSTLSELADSMGYFQSSESGHTLNVSRSIQSTMRKGGVPALEFHKRQQLRSLLILEDDFAEPLVWNSLAQELADGMARLGIPIIYGRFHGSPEQFKTTDGVIHRLEDLEDQRHGYLLLIFTDGKSLQRQNSAFALESLARWPMVAWMELREPRAWDESTALPLHYGIPLYPATPSGTLDAVRSFLTEHGSDADFANNDSNRPHMPTLAGAKLDAYVEQLLGDSLLWAQECAMLQPISPGLADALRRQFHKQLPAERIQRLYTLPDTQYNIAGLRFSTEVLRVLRTGFLIRRKEAEQENVLRFLIQQIEKTEPNEKDSLAHLAWEAVKERVRLELDQDQALARLSQLAKTPLASAISVSLNGFGFYEEGRATTNQTIPLRLKPNNPFAWQRLARITDNFNIPRMEAYPIAWGHRLLLGVLGLLFVVNSGLSISNYIQPTLPNQNWRIANSRGTYALLKSRTQPDDVWRMEKSDELEKLTGVALQPNIDYQLTLYGNGSKTINPIFASNHRMTVVTVQYKEFEANCLEKLPEIGLIVERCASTADVTSYESTQLMWRQRIGESASFDRLLSIGIEIDSKGEDAQDLWRLRDVLLRSSSVDVIYRMRPAIDGSLHIDQVVDYIEEDLGAAIGRSQLIWWIARHAYNQTQMSDLLAKFDRSLELDDDQGDAFEKLNELLSDYSNGELVTEEEIRDKLAKKTTGEIRSPIVLVRPRKEVTLVRTPTWSPTFAATIPYTESQPVSSQTTGFDKTGQAPLQVTATALLTESSLVELTYPYIYRIIASECISEPKQRIQSGFRVAGKIGVFTTLHGVAGCNTLVAQSDDNDQTFRDLVIGNVDIERDVAVLQSNELSRSPQNGLKMASQTDNTELGDSYLIIGFHSGGLLNYRQTESRNLVRIELRNMLPTDMSASFAKRQSPAIDIEVFQIQVHFTPGSSGAPIINSHGEIIGIMNGGLEAGMVEIAWAVPMDTIDLATVSLNDLSKLELLGQTDTASAFSFDTSASVVSTPIPTVLINDRCRFSFQIIGENLDPVRSAQIKVFYGSESVEGVSDNYGEYRGEISCDMPNPVVNLEVAAAGFAPIRKNVRLTSDRTQIKLSILVTPKLTPFTATPLSLTPLPTATATSTLVPSSLETTTSTFQSNTAFTFAAFSPDGKTIVSASGDNSLRLWDATTGKEELTLQGHTGAVNSAAFSPDGKTIVSASWDNTLKVWDAATGTVLNTLIGHTDFVNSATFSPDEKTIVSASWDNTLKLWDVDTGTEIRTFIGHTSAVNSVAFSPDGKTIVSASSDTTIKLWDVDTGTEIRTFIGHTFAVNSVAFSPDGKTIVSASSDTTIKLWDARTGQEIRTLAGHISVVNSATFSPDGRWIVSASADHTLKLWDTITGKEIRTLDGHTSSVNSADFSPDGKTIVSASSDKTFKLWDVATGKQIDTNSESILF